MGGGRSGVFPYNYVEPLTIASLTAPVAATSEVSAAINGNQEPVAAAEAVVTEAASPIADAAPVDNAVTTATVSAEADAAPAPAAVTAASLEPGNTGTLTTPSGKKSKKKKKDDVSDSSFNFFLRFLFKRTFFSP